MHMNRVGWLALLVAVASACAERSVRFDDGLLPLVPAGGSTSSPSMGGTGASPSGGVAGSSSQPPVVGSGGGGASAGAGAGGSLGLPQGGEGGASDGEGGAGDGESGAGNEAGAGPLTPQPPDPIDEVEAGAFPALPVRAGRNGAWFGARDESGGFAAEPSLVPLVPSRGVSHFAARFGGGGFTGWGAQLGVSLRSPVVGYDASAYCGVRFVAKGFGAGWTLLISDKKSSPSGGVCDSSSGDPSLHCYDHLGKSFEPRDAWQTYDVSFAELRPFKGFTGEPRPLEKSALFDVVFNFENPNGAPFELLIDDLAFAPCAERSDLSPSSR